MSNPFIKVVDPHAESHAETSHKGIKGSALTVFASLMICFLSICKIQKRAAKRPQIAAIQTAGLTLSLSFKQT